MANFVEEQSEVIVKREMVLFFLVDQSGSMDGKKMGAVNTAVREVIPDLKKIGGADVDLKVAVLMFSSGCKWMHASGPISVDDFVWNNIEAGGTTDLGNACLELNDKMSRSKFLNRPSGSVAPAIFLMSDGSATDEYNGGLAQLQKNNWYKHAIKIAVAIGDDAEIHELAKFTGSKEAVITVHTPEALKKMIKFVSITSAQIGSQSQSSNTQTKQENMIQQVQDFVHSDPSLDPNNVSTDAGDW